jgi:hypothetical protein
MRKKTIRLGKKGWASGTFRETHKGPVRFYDYNF